MNLSSTIIPKSDQLNADDLISGPRTIKIMSVQPGSKEQPVSIGFDGDTGRPYKPSKSMRRVLVTLWGNEGSAYIGRRLTIYRDPEVKFGGDAVGGIKISHASDISQPATIVLTESRAKRKPFRVEVLENEAPETAKKAAHPNAAIHSSILKALEAATGKLATKEEKAARKAELCKKYFEVDTWPLLTELPAEKLENCLLNLKQQEELL